MSTVPSDPARWHVNAPGWASSGEPLTLTTGELYEALAEMDHYHEAAVESLAATEVPADV